MLDVTIKSLASNPNSDPEDREGSIDISFDTGLIATGDGPNSPFIHLTIHPNSGYNFVTLSAVQAGLLINALMTACNSGMAHAQRSQEGD